MASQQAAPAGSPPSAQVVGNAFVQQFYLILHQSPELLHRFYQESSRLGRPEANGEMSTVSTLQAINEKILSMDYSEYRAQIKTVDAQESLRGGVIVLVTGYLTGMDDVKREFTQTFFLATQDKGYYVLNDIFRYAEESDQQQEEQGLANEIDNLHTAEPDYIPSREEHVTEQTTAVPEEDEVNAEELYFHSEHEEGSAVDDEELVDEVINEVPTISQAAIAETGTSTGQEQKKSYASIVRVMKENNAPVPLAASAPGRPAPTNTERHTSTTHAPPLPTSYDIAAAAANTAESSIVQVSEVDGFSIYIKSLPLNATPAQLEEEFKKFGPIKRNGIQVRSNKLLGFCFGFVEFEVASAVQSAIEASPITIGGRQAHVEEKRTTGSRVNRGRFPPDRGGGFHGDGMRGRGSYGGGGGYGRGDYNNRSDFGKKGGGRGGSFSPRGDVEYQRIDYTSSNGRRGSRSGSPSTSSSQRSFTSRVPMPS